MRFSIIPNMTRTVIEQSLDLAVRFIFTYRNKNYIRLYALTENLAYLPILDKDAPFYSKSYDAYNLTKLPKRDAYEIIKFLSEKYSKPSLLFIPYAFL